VLAGKRPCRPELIAPHRRPSTTIGVATTDRIPSRRRRHRRRRRLGCSRRGEPGGPGEHAELLAALGIRGREAFGLAGAARGQANNRTDRAGDDEKPHQTHHIVGVSDREVVQRRQKVVGQQRRSRDRSGQRREQPTDQRHNHDGQEVKQHPAGQVKDLAKLRQTYGQQRKYDQPGQRPGEPAPRGERHAPGGQPSSGPGGLAGDDTRPSPQAGGDRERRSRTGLPGWEPRPRSVGAKRFRHPTSRTRLSSAVVATRLSCPSRVQLAVQIQ
jgi:hypothetical protein